MPPPNAALRTISQEAFDELVKENIEDLGMDPTEALDDAIQSLSLQGVDLSGIVTCLPGEQTSSHPVIQCLHKLQQIDSNADVDLLLNQLNQTLQESGNSAIAVKNGGIELLCSTISNIPIGVTASALNALALLLNDIQAREKFRSSGGPAIVVNILKDRSESLKVVDSGFAVVAAAATGNEVVKQSFMELKVDEIILRELNRENKGGVQGLYDAIRVLLTADDNRVVASQVYGYARKFAKIGISEALVKSLHEGITSPGLVSACIALKAVAVNDEICKSVAESGGIDAILRCIVDSGAQQNKTVARTCCALLSKSKNGKLRPEVHNECSKTTFIIQNSHAPTKLAGSDSNKSAIVEKGGMDKLIQLAARFSDDPFVLQEVMSIFTVLCLRSPENAARATEASAGELAIQAMDAFPNAQQLQRNSCLMIRNLVVRNPENRTLLLGQGIEAIIRRAKQNHETCRDAASDALRDLGLDNYNA